MARIVGNTERLPNDVLGDLIANFSSEHGSITNFLLAGSSIRLISDDTDPIFFRRLSTRDGNVPGWAPAGAGSTSPSGSDGSSGDGSSGDGGDG
jgi:hypothetical protein